MSLVGATGGARKAPARLAYRLPPPARCDHRVRECVRRCAPAPLRAPAGRSSRSFAFASRPPHILRVAADLFGRFVLNLRAEGNPGRTAKAAMVYLEDPLTGDHPSRTTAEEDEELAEVFADAYFEPPIVQVRPRFPLRREKHRSRAKRQRHGTQIAIRPGGAKEEQGRASGWGRWTREQQEGHEVFFRCVPSVTRLPHGLFFFSLSFSFFFSKCRLLLFPMRHLPRL